MLDFKIFERFLVEYNQLNFQYESHRVFLFSLLFFYTISMFMQDCQLNR